MSEGGAIHSLSDHIMLLITTTTEEREEDDTLDDSARGRNRKSKEDRQEKEEVEVEVEQKKREQEILETEKQKRDDEAEIKTAEEEEEEDADDKKLEDQEADDDASKENKNTAKGTSVLSRIQKFGKKIADVVSGRLTTQKKKDSEAEEAIDDDKEDSGDEAAEPEKEVEKLEEEKEEEEEIKDKQHETDNQEVVEERIEEDNTNSKALEDSKTEETAPAALSVAEPLTSTQVETVDSVVVQPVNDKHSRKKKEKGPAVDISSLENHRRKAFENVLKKSVNNKTKDPVGTFIQSDVINVDPKTILEYYVHRHSDIAIYLLLSNIVERNNVDDSGYTPIGWLLDHYLENKKTDKQLSKKDEEIFKHLVKDRSTNFNKVYKDESVVDLCIKHNLVRLLAIYCDAVADKIDQKDKINAVSYAIKTYKIVFAEFTTGHELYKHRDRLLGFFKHIIDLYDPQMSREIAQSTIKKKVYPDAVPQLENDKVLFEEFEKSLDNLKREDDVGKLMSQFRIDKETIAEYYVHNHMAHNLAHVVYTMNGAIISNKRDSEGYTLLGWILNDLNENKTNKTIFLESVRAFRILVTRRTTSLQDVNAAKDSAVELCVKYNMPKQLLFIFQTDEKNKLEDKDIDYISMVSGDDKRIAVEYTTSFLNNKEENKSLEIREMQELKLLNEMWKQSLPAK